MFNIIEKTAMLRAAAFGLPAVILLVICQSAAATEMQPDSTYFRDTFCSNQTLLIGNQIFDPSNPSGTVVLPGASFDGSDSVIAVSLLFRQPVHAEIKQNLCVGDTIWVNGTAYHAGFYLGQETVEGGASNGCDSIIDVALTFYPTVLNYHATICEGDTVYFNGHAYSAFHPQGEEMIPHGAVSGCDSIIRVDLEVLTPPYFILRDTLCPDDVLMINGHRYDRDNRTGLEILKGASSTGCDSLLYLELVFRNLWVYLGEDREVVKGDTVCIAPQYNLTPQTLEWYPAPPCGDPACLTDCVQPLSSVKYTLKVTDINGCVLNDDILISVSDRNRVFAPHVFSPDARWPDNRFFLSADNGVALIKRLLIVDRWGETMFDREDVQPDDPAAGWDGMARGKIAQTGVYTYWADLVRLDGTRFTKAGTFSLVR